MRKNCWEVMECGREPGGANVEISGVCSAAMSKSYDGSNLGMAAGRCCWQVAGSLSGSGGDCNMIPDPGDCFDCAFFKRVRYEEAGRFRL